MKAPLLFRIAAFVFVLFALGHTVGFLTFKSSSAEARAVFDSMNSVYFTEDGKIFSYGGWYRGFGLSATASMIFEAALAWILAGMAKRGSRDAVTLGWAFFAWQIPGAVLSFLYFGIPPMVLSLLVALLLAAAAWRAQAGQAATSPDQPAGR